MNSSSNTGNEPCTNISNVLNRIAELNKTFKKYGVHSQIHMRAAGFEYTGDGDKARCEQCGLEVSQWTLDMIPFVIHSQSRPDCPFVLSLKSSTTSKHSSTNDTQERSSKRQRTEDTNSNSISNSFFENDTRQQVRQRTFSHWPHQTNPSQAQMIEAGFFYCNIADRVICIYCNIICQQWRPLLYDPWEVHRTLSPNCEYVKAKLMNPVVSIINSRNESSAATSHSDLLQTHNDTSNGPHHPNYSEIHIRRNSYAAWSNESPQFIDKLVTAGFFYTGNGTMLTCFYCNGSLERSNMKFSPILEHIRVSPHCAYAKQVCHPDIYHQFMERERAKQQRATNLASNERTDLNNGLNSNLIDNDQQLQKDDENAFAQKVAERLEWSMSKHLLDQNFSLSTIKHCWERQLQIKRDDFVSEDDLYIACLVLKKQCECIDGKAENIVIPGVKMRLIRNLLEMNQDREKPATQVSDSMDVSSNNPNTITTPSSSFLSSRLKTTINPSQEEMQTDNQALASYNYDEQAATSQSNNTCMLCSVTKKQLACIPCSHFVICIRCSESVQSCPKCGEPISAYVRIYL